MWRILTVLQNIVNQGLFVMVIELGREDMFDKGSQVGIGFWWIDLGYCEHT